MPRPFLMGNNLPCRPEDSIVSSYLRNGPIYLGGRGRPCGVKPLEPNLNLLGREPIGRPRGPDLPEVSVSNQKTPWFCGAAGDAPFISMPGVPFLIDSPEDGEKAGKIGETGAFTLAREQPRTALRWCPGPSCGPLQFRPLARTTGTVPFEPLPWKIFQKFF